MPKLVTAEWLASKNACSDQVAVFRTCYPDGLVLAPGALVTAAAHKLDVSWASRFISVPHRATFCQAMAPHWVAFYQAMAPHLEKYLDDLRDA